MKRFFVVLVLLIVSGNAIAAQSIYCPQRQGYVNVGMTVAEVVAACGEPLSKTVSEQPATQKLPVKQLIYTTLNQGALYQGLDSTYTTWSLPSGSTGVSLEIDIVNNKISAMRINGSDTNAMSLCGNSSVQVGDPEANALNACGNPSMVNNTYVNQPIPSAQPPEVWIYQVDQYQPPMSLTFVDGKLQSIN